MTAENEFLVSEQLLQVPYCYSAGPVASRFLVALREEQKIYGTKCGGCGRVYVPPRSFCGRCAVRPEEWVEVGPEGELVNFTVAYYHEPVHPAPPPYVIGIIRLVGADTGLVHQVRTTDPAAIHIGMKLRPVWAPARRGHILDISHFEPIIP